MPRTAASPPQPRAPSRTWLQRAETPARGWPRSRMTCAESYPKQPGTTTRSITRWAACSTDPGADGMTMGGPQSARRDAAHIDDVDREWRSPSTGCSSSPTALGHSRSFRRRWAIRLEHPAAGAARHRLGAGRARAHRPRRTGRFRRTPTPRSTAWSTPSAGPTAHWKPRWWRRDVGGKMIRFVVCRNLRGPLRGAGPQSCPSGTAGRRADDLSQVGPTLSVCSTLPLPGT